MLVFENVDGLQEYLKHCRSEGKTIALVLTMGCLHEGHLQLIDKAKTCADVVIVSIFVNPTQFAPDEDFDKYPHNAKADKEHLIKIKTDVLFLPSVDEIYPNTQKSDYDTGEMGKILCGKSRSTHFNGVAQVVSRFFDIVEPNIAVFGEKDYQQLQIIRQLVKRQKRTITIDSTKTVRESDSLAISTRNKYLSASEREIAPNFNKVLQQAKSIYQNGAKLNAVIEQAKTSLIKHFDLDYFEILDANTLTQINTSTIDIIVISAVKLGGTRLIDNIVFRRLNV